MSFSPSRHPNLNNFIRSLLLSEEQLVAFQTALADDQALQPSITPTATSRQDFDRLEQEVKHLTTTLRVSNKAPVTTSHQRSYEIKFALSHGARATIDDKTNAEIVQKISSKGAPFNQVVACRLERTALVLMVTNPEAEAALHLQQHMIGPMLEVPKEDCTLLAQSYQVQIVNLGSRAKVQFKQPMDFITAWGRRNRVIIKDARWTYKKLIWTLDRLGDAQKLVHAKGVVLSGHMAYAKAYDKRSSPKQCFTCGRYGHLKNQCPTPNDLNCLRCSSKDHRASEGKCNGVECCINCGRNHPSWGPQCQDPITLRAINESRKHAERKVFWEFFPLVDDDPTVDTLPKVSKGDAQELSLASVAEPDVSRAETSIQYDTELDSQLPFPDSQESFELSNEGDMDMDEYLSQDVASDLEVPSSDQPSAGAAQTYSRSLSMASNTSVRCAPAPASTQPFPEHMGPYRETRSHSVASSMSYESFSSADMRALSHPKPLDNSFVENTPTSSFVGRSKTLSPPVSQPMVPKPASCALTPTVTSPSSSQASTQEESPKAAATPKASATPSKAFSQPPTRIPAPASTITRSTPQSSGSEFPHYRNFPSTKMGPVPRVKGVNPEPPTNWPAFRNENEGVVVKRRRVRVKGPNNSTKRKAGPPPNTQTALDMYSRYARNSSNNG